MIMRKLLFLLSLIGFGLIANSQDLIVFKDASEIEAKVLEIRKNDLSYKQWTNLDGPTYVVEKAEVLFIKYANGTKDVFNVDPKPDSGASYRPGRGGGSGSGVGAGSGTGHGEGISSDIGYGIGTRGFTYMPDLRVSYTGMVYVEVHVGSDGSVLDARVINNSKYPTTITDSRIQAECVAKAKTAKYKPGKEELRIIVFK